MFFSHLYYTYMSIILCHQKCLVVIYFNARSMTQPKPKHRRATWPAYCLRVTWWYSWESHSCFVFARSVFFPLNSSGLKFRATAVIDTLPCTHSLISGQTTIYNQQFKSQMSGVKHHRILEINLAGWDFLSSLCYPLHPKPHSPNSQFPPLPLMESRGLKEQ